jgi:hypothetical protein
MPRIVSVRPLNDYRLEVQFDDGAGGIVPMADRLFGPMFEPLKDWQTFCQVTVDSFGAVCWPNGADLAPDGIYEKIRASGSTSLAQ